MKHKRCPTSNPRFDIELTDAQWDIIDYIGLEAETAFVYPFAIEFEDITMEMIDSIVKLYEDAMYECCAKILGINPERQKKANTEG